MWYIAVDGLSIDIASDKIALKYDGLTTADGMTLNRSQSLALPATQRNRAIFGMPDRPDFFAAESRRSYNATMYYDGGCVDGVLAVTDVTDTINATFVYGQLTTLQSVREAGNISDWLQIAGVEDAAINLNSTTENSENSLTLNQAVYFNGHSEGLRYPSVKVAYLLALAALRFGFTLGQSLGSSQHRLLLNTINAKLDLVNGSAFVSYSASNVADYNISGITGISTYMSEITVTMSDECVGMYDKTAGATVPATVTMHALRCINKFHLSVSGSNIGAVTDVLKAKKANSGWHVLRGWDGGLVTPRSLAAMEVGNWITLNGGLEIDLAPMDLLVYIKFEQHAIEDRRFSPYVQLPYYRFVFAATDYVAAHNIQFTFAVKGDGEKIQDVIGLDGKRHYNDYYLSANLPKIGLLDLAKAEAISQGGLLVYNSGTLSVFNYDFDGAGGTETEIDGILVAVKKVSREVAAVSGSYMYKVSLKMDEGLSAKGAAAAGVYYDIPNLVLTGEAATELALSAADWYTAGQNPPLCNVSCVEFDDGGLEQLSDIGDYRLVDGYELSSSIGAIKPVTLPSNEHFARICSLSTAIEVTVRMQMFKFISLKPFDRFTYRGGKYYCVSGSWSANVATLTLQRYK